MMSPWLAMGAVLALFGALTAGLRAYQGRRAPNPELVRKLLHVGMGLLSLAFPWLFRTTWPVFLLAAVFMLGLGARRASRTLQGLLGGVLDGVGRESLGEVYFPIAVGLLFLFSGGEPLTFCIPMLILSLADGAAALVGARYGTLRVPRVAGEKSLEGSLAFFTVAFLSSHIPLLLLSKTGRAESLLIAAVLGLQLMLLEATAGRGLDNLFIPLGGFLLLKSILGLDVPSLIARLALTLFLVAFLVGICLGRSTTDPKSWRSNRWSSWGARPNHSGGLGR